MTEQTASGRREPDPAEEDPSLATEPEGGELGEGELEDEDRPRRRWPRETVIAWALVAALALIALALLWNAAEAHYQGCVQAVGVRTAGDNSPLGRFARQDVTKCTRSPF